MSSDNPHRSYRDNDHSRNDGPRHRRDDDQRRHRNHDSRDDRGGRRYGDQPRGRNWEDRGQRNDRDRHWDNRGDDRRRDDRPRGRNWEERGRDDRPRGRNWEDRGGERRRDDRPRGRNWEDRGDRRGGGDRDRRGGHAQRGGAQRRDRFQAGPQRSGFREDRMAHRANEPELPNDIDVQDLDPMVRQDLRVLSRDNADRVAKHMIMAAVLLEEDPKKALEHARAAKDRAGRVAVARETCGITAYHAGEWKEALSELRAARRISGGPGLLAVMADCERGLGRPDKAVEMARGPEVQELDPDSRIELAIVVAGARRDMQQKDAALVTLQRMDPQKSNTTVSGLRLAYAYADALQDVGRTEEAKEWFTHVAEHDREFNLFDAEDRLKELS